MTLEPLTESWRLNNKYHRTSGQPAKVGTEGTLEWCIKGQPHREGGPALLEKNGAQWWYNWGELHRTGMPAVIWASGVKWWYYHGVLTKVEQAPKAASGPPD